MTDAPRTDAPRPPIPGMQRWVSLMVHDLAASQGFYRELFGWDYQEGPSQFGRFVRAVRGGRQVAGLGQMGPGARPGAAWLPFIATDDTDATAALIRGCGGTVAVGPLESPGVGRVAIASDVSGAAFGLWQGGPGRRAPLGGAEGVPVWNELITADTTLVMLFYAMVFGYDTLPEPTLPADVDYLVLCLKDQPVAGIRGVGNALPRDQGPHWLPYFSTADADASAGLAVRLGARLLRGPEDSPFGRLAWLSDPEGAPFAVLRRPGDDGA